MHVLLLHGGKKLNIIYILWLKSWSTTFTALYTERIKNSASLLPSSQHIFQSSSEHFEVNVTLAGFITKTKISLLFAAEWIWKGRMCKCKWGRWKITGILGNKCSSEIKPQSHVKFFVKKTVNDLVKSCLSMSRFETNINFFPALHCNSFNFKFFLPQAVTIAVRFFSDNFNLHRKLWKLMKKAEHSLL